MNVYGDIEGCINIINAVISNYNKSVTNIFLGDLVPNAEDKVKLRHSINFLEWLLKQYVEIKHYNKSEMSQFTIWNRRGLNLKTRTQFTSKLPNLILLIGNKEVKMWRKLDKLTLEEHDRMILETYLYYCIPYHIIGTTLFSHSYYMIDDIDIPVNRVIAGHSRSYGNFKFNGIDVTVCDLTEYYNRKYRIIFETKNKPRIYLSDSDNYSTGGCMFYTPEFKLKPQ